MPNAVADDVDAAFAAALSADAGVTPTEIPAPPRRAATVDPDAPHGRDEHGTPHAPWGVGANGKPRIKPAGPGRPKSKDEQARVAATPKGASGGAPKGGGHAEDADYSGDLAGLGMSVWMGGAALPATRPYAHLWKQSLPGMVNAWNEAAKQNATVRGYVEKLAGDGSYAWVIGVALSTAPLVAGCLELAKRGKTAEDKAERAQLRAQYANACEAELREFMAEQMAAMGMAPAAAAA